MTASKTMSVPLELVVLSVIKASTLESFNVTSPSAILMGSSKAKVMSELTAIPVSESPGVKSRFGAV